IRRWRLPAGPARTLPVPVTLKRFLAPDLVFILGILRSSLLVFFAVALMGLSRFRTAKVVSTFAGNAPRELPAFMNRLGMPFGRAARLKRTKNGKTTFGRGMKKLCATHKGRPEKPAV